VILACGGSITKLRYRTLSYLERNLEEFKWKDGELWKENDEGVTKEVIGTQDSAPSAAFQRIVRRAVIHTQSANQEEVNGARALGAIFAEKKATALHFLQKENITRYDVVNYISHGISKNNSAARVASMIDEIAISAPVFKATGGRLRYQQTPAIGEISERKKATKERLTDLQALCNARANEQPQLKNVVDRYAAALTRLRADQGAYSLLLAGLELETLIKIKSNSETDRERNPPLGSDQLFSAQSLIIAHAGLITLFPDIQNITNELDRYRELSEGMDALRDRILDPVLHELAAAGNIFDEETQQISNEIIALNRAAKIAGETSTRGEISTKHSWIRGALASIGQYIFKHASDTLKVARDATVKEAVSHFFKNSDQLSAAINAFLAAAKPALLTLAHNLQSTFGWITSLFQR